MIDTFLKENSYTVHVCFPLGVNTSSAVSSAIHEIQLHVYMYYTFKGCVLIGGWFKVKHL